MRIHVSNLDGKVTDEQLRSLFENYGEVASAQVQYDVFTGASRGFGYVEMGDEETAKKAITELNGSVQGSQNISVRETEPEPVHKGSYKVGNGTASVFRFKRNRK